MTRATDRCSTPEGIGAAITAILDRIRLVDAQCSTPEGIGAAITHVPASYMGMF